MSDNFERKLVWISIAVFSSLMLILAFSADGTGDEGDSILHFLFSRFAFEHPENFLNHWAKPGFVLLTAPVAQGGFIAMKIFNVALLAATIWLTWRIAKVLDISHAWAVIFPIMTAPMTISHTLSGLTEPMFAFWLMAGILLYVKKQPFSATIWMSFLPFVRSEGLIVFCVLLIYLTLKRNWKVIPFLATGHLVYSFIGYFHYEDFLWVFNKMTYATPTSAYGSGPLLHFADKMHIVLGDYLPLLLLMGVLIGGGRIVLFWLGRVLFSKEELWLVYGIAIAYFVAHSLFWYLGIFNSFGLMRVMIGVIPLFAVIMIRGINFLLEKAVRPSVKFPSVLGLGVLLPVVFLFIKLDYKKDLMLKDAQRTQSLLAEKYKNRYEGYTFYFDAIHPALAFDVDWFHSTEHRQIPQLFSGEPVPKKSVAVWDSWFSRVEWKIPLEKMREDKRLKEIECIEIDGKKSCLFEFDSIFANQKVMMQTSFEMESDISLSDSTNFKTGRFSKVVGKKRPFSPSFTGWMNSFSEIENAFIRVSYSAFIPEGGSPRKNKAVTVISFESAGKTFKYNAESVFDKDDEPGVWKFVEIQVPVPKYKTERDKIKVYVWNPGNDDILIDDWRVTWRQEK